MTYTTDTVIARRSTSDGKTVCLWSDGSLTWALGSVIKGSANPRTIAASTAALRAGWLVLGDVELYDADEVTPLIGVARKVAARGGDPGDMRAAFATSTAVPMPGGWTVLATDRDGNPTERSWHFPRLTPMRDLAIYHVRGTYRVMREVPNSRGTYMCTGFESSTLREAFANVRTIIGAA